MACWFVLFGFRYFFFFFFTATEWPLGEPLSSCSLPCLCIVSFSHWFADCRESDKLCLVQKNGLLQVKMLCLSVCELQLNKNTSDWFISSIFDHFHRLESPSMLIRLGCCTEVSEMKTATSFHPILRPTKTGSHLNLKSPF